MALRVIPLEEIEPFFALKDEGLTGRQLLKLQMPSCVSRSMKHQNRSSDEEEEEEGEGRMEIGSRRDSEGEVKDEESLSEDARMCRDLLKAVKLAKVGVVGKCGCGEVRVGVGVKMGMSSPSVSSFTADDQRKTH